MVDRMIAHTQKLTLLAATLAIACSAYAADGGFASSFETSDPALHATARDAGIAIGNGPKQPYAAKAGMGYSGLHALQYRSSGKTQRSTLYEVDIPVQADTTLSWLVLPEIVDSDTAASTGVSLDLLFDDGKRLSQLDVRDQHGVRIGAQPQAESKTLYPQQWARKAVRLGDSSALRGRRIKAIELDIAPVAGKPAQGWIDDVAIAEQPRTTVSHPSDHVLTTRGTQSNGSFSRGNNLVATAMPHGFNFWVPVTDAGKLNWLYSWNEGNDADNKPRLQALAISHQPSPWMGDRQTFQVMPSSARGIPDADRGKRALAFSHARETARPYTYQVDFDNGLQAAIAPTERAAIMRFRFPRDGDANLLFDNVDERGGLTLDKKTSTLSGYTDTRSGLSNGASRLFVYARFDQPWIDNGAIRTGRPTGYIKFKPEADGEVRMRIATSLMSVEQAKRNLDMEIGTAGFDQVRDRARAAWDRILGRVKVAGASDDQLTTVYSNLYRLYLYPNIAHENVGTAQAPEWKHADQNEWTRNNTRGDDTRTAVPLRDGKVYVNNGFWDTFRTAWPAYALFTPKQAGELVQGFLQQYQDGGWVARWSSPGYADLMVGTSSDVAFTDAWLKGIRGFDASQAYQAALRNATVVPPVSNVGRKGMLRSQYRGYADNQTHEGMSWSLEGALNDFGVAQLGTAIASTGRGPQAKRLQEEAEYFRARAASYSNLFDPATGFFRGRKQDGQWAQPAATYDPRIWGGDYTESNAWTFAFTAAHDGNGLASLYGGQEGLARKLDSFFSTPETAEKKFSGSYGDVIHEMTEARDVRMGMYAHSNQPSHHIPWMYVYAGQPWKTQAITREVLQRLYLGSEIGQGYPGDEDNGEMSAWYLFAAMGLYPLRMGAPEYIIGSPLFERFDMTMDNGTQLHVIARNNSRDNVYVQSLKLNGKPWTKPWSRHADIADGATLEFVMGPKPSQWGSKPADLPPSLTAAGQAPAQLHDLVRPAMARVDGGNANALFDDDAATALRLAKPQAGIAVQLPSPTQATFYTLTNAVDPAALEKRPNERNFEAKARPASSDTAAVLTGLGWTLEGRTGSGDWTELDRRQQQDFQWQGQLRPFKIARPGAYSEYRLRFEGSTPVALAEVELLAPGNPIQDDR